MLDLRQFLLLSIYKSLQDFHLASFLLVHKAEHPFPSLLHQPSKSYPYCFSHHLNSKMIFYSISSLNALPSLKGQLEPELDEIHQLGHSIQERLKILKVLQLLSVRNLCTRLHHTFFLRLLLCPSLILYVLFENQLDRDK